MFFYKIYDTKILNHKLQNQQMFQQWNRKRVFMKFLSKCGFLKKENVTRHKIFEIQDIIRHITAFI